MKTNIVTQLDFNTAITELSKKLDTIEKESKSARSFMDLTEQKLNELLRNIYRLSSNYEELAVRTNALESRVDTLHADISHAVSDTNAAVKNCMDMIQCSIESRTDALAEQIKNQNSALNEKLEASIKEISGIKTAVASNAEDIKEVRANAEKLRDELANTPDEITAEVNRLLQNYATVSSLSDHQEKVDAAISKFEKNEKWKTQLIDIYIIGTWNLTGACDSNFYYYREQYNTNNLITKRNRLAYFCCEYERGNERNAVLGMRNYCKKVGTSMIAEFLPLAYIAHKNGIGEDDEYIMKAAAIFEHLENNRRDQALKHYLSGKTFAIVGNAPSILGTGAGKDIDSRDVVFRMNTFAARPEHFADTGSKITAFADNANNATINHPNHINCDGYELIFIPYDFWHIYVSQFCDPKSFLDSMYDIIVNKKKLVCYLGPENSIEMKKRLDVISPSCGIALIWEIYKQLGEVHKEDFFGFTEEEFPDGIHDNEMKDAGDEQCPLIAQARLDHYNSKDNLSTFYAAPIYTCNHNYNHELLLRRELFAEAEEKNK